MKQNYYPAQTPPSPPKFEKPHKTAYHTLGHISGLVKLSKGNGMPVSVGDITMYMGPREIGGPDSLEEAIIGFIEGATIELQISVQELDHKPIADAIIAARLRGVRVHMVMEQDYLKEGKPPRADSLGEYEINRELLMRILRTGIDAKADYNPHIFHQKFIIRDKVSVLTGSTNFTTTGVTKNLNHVVIVHDKTVAGEYRKEFREIRKGIFGKRSLERSRKPLEDHYVSNMRVKPLFAPDHMPEMEFIKQMNKARERIDFAIFTFSKSSGIDDAMVLSKIAGVNVSGVMDRRAVNQKWAAKDTLAGADIDIFQNKTGTGVRKVHHKLMTIDDKITIVGSFNYTGPANLTNDENIVVFGDMDETDLTRIGVQNQFALYARQEIERIIEFQSERI
ncbi:MAG: phospholipase D-like domain-containing protein [Rhizobiaceae bacterium]|nr:phospholipase D-like domain-containing protein [Rhizobiaceae bacterium]